MRNPVAAAVAVAVFSCGGDFTAGNLGFSSTLSRESLKWTPERGVVAGSTFGLTAEPTCFNCPRGTLTLAAQGAGVTVNGSAVTTPMSGVVSVQATTTTGGTGAFTFNVADPSAVVWEEPLVAATRQYPQPGPDELPVAVPRVGDDELVVHRGGTALLELWATAGGDWLGNVPGALTARGPAVTVDLDVIAVQGVDQTVTLSLSDGGAPTQRRVRAGDLEEVVGLELLAGRVVSYELVLAIARREDGGVYYGAPVQWTSDGGVVPWDYTSNRRPRRADVAGWYVTCQNDDAGATVTATLGAHSASVTFPCAVVEPEPPAPELPKQCGCSTGPGALALCALLVARRRRRQ